MKHLIFIFSSIIGIIIVYQFSKTFYDSKEYFLEDPEEFNDSDYFAQRFILPLYPKYLIDQWKYKFWFITFLIFNFMLYFIIVYLLINAEPDIKDIPNLNNIQKFIYLGHPQIFGALIITGLLPILPESADIQKWFRNFAQARANIPNYARDYYKNIKRNGLNLSDASMKNTVGFYEGSIVQKEDFEFRDNSPEKIWALTCYIYYQINEMTKEANSLYSKNIAKEELAYKNFEKNFSAIKKNFATKDSRDFSDSNKSLLEALFSQSCQIIVCLIFCSEPNDRKAIEQFEKIGIIVKKDTKYKIRYDLLLPLSFLIFIAVFILPWLIGYCLSIYGIGLPEQLTGKWAYRASIASLFILYCPILITHLAKFYFIDKWPIRASFDRMKPAPLSLIFLICLIWGIVSFFFLDFIFPEMFEESVIKSLPFAILSGLTGSIIAIFIDKSPTTWNFRKVFIKSILIGILCAIIFTIFAVLAILIANPDINLNHIRNGEFWEKRFFIMLLTGTIGFIIGFVNYLISDYSKLIEDSETFLGMNIDHYISPFLKGKNIVKDCDEVLKILILNRKKLPLKLFEYLKKNKIIDMDEFFTTKGLNQIKKYSFD